MHILLIILSRTFGTAQWIFDVVSTPKSGPKDFAGGDDDGDDDDDDNDDDGDGGDDDGADDDDDGDDDDDDNDKHENFLISVPKVSWQMHKSAAE